MDELRVTWDAELSGRLLALLLIGYIILNIVHNRRRRKKKMRRVNKKFK